MGIFIFSLPILTVKQAEQQSLADQLRKLESKTVSFIISVLQIQR